MTLATANSARRRLPPLSTVASRIVQQASQEDPDLASLGRLIELDPALTVAVLRLVNSPFYGLSRQVATVNEAIMVLGMGTVRRVALTTAVAHPIQQLGLKRSLLEAVWRKSLAGAVLACNLLDGHAQSQVAFTAGVLQDLGRLDLYLRSPENYAAMECLAGAELCEAEQRSFGLTHAEAGAELAEAWALPPVIVEAIVLHHRPGPNAPEVPVAQAVWLASLVGDGELGLFAMPTLLHIQTDIIAAQVASQREVATLYCAVGV